MTQQSFIILKLAAKAAKSEITLAFVSTSYDCCPKETEIT